MPKKKTPIQLAVAAVGGQAQLARALSAERPEDAPIPAALVWQWVQGRRPVAPQHCLPIEKVTDGKVTRYDLRPDVFGEKAA